MVIEKTPDECDNEFSRKIEFIENKMNKSLLTDEDLLMLACREISKTYTRDEKNYA